MGTILLMLFCLLMFGFVRATGEDKKSVDQALDNMDEDAMNSILDELIGKMAADNAPPVAAKAPSSIPTPSVAAKSSTFAETQAGAPPADSSTYPIPDGSTPEKGDSASSSYTGGGESMTSMSAEGGGSAAAAGLSAAGGSGSAAMASAAGSPVYESAVGALGAATALAPFSGADFGAVPPPGKEKKSKSRKKKQSQPEMVPTPPVSETGFTPESLAPPAPVSAPVPEPVPASASTSAQVPEAASAPVSTSAPAPAETTGNSGHPMESGIQSKSSTESNSSATLSSASSGASTAVPSAPSVFSVPVAVPVPPMVIGSSKTKKIKSKKAEKDTPVEPNQPEPAATPEVMDAQASTPSAPSEAPVEPSQPAPVSGSETTAAPNPAPAVLAEKAVPSKPAAEAKPATSESEIPAEKGKQTSAGDAPSMEIPPLARLIPMESIKNNSVSITRPKDEHDLLTVGDFVYLPPPSFKTLTLNEKYLIYRVLAKSFLENNQGQWCERIGKLEIWEINPQIVTGRIVAASDIIKKGDLICLQDPHN